MAAATYEGVVEGGQIRLAPGVSLPEKTNVYVVVPSPAVEESFEVVLPKNKGIYIRSPRLLYPEQAADFVMEVSEASERLVVTRTLDREVE